MADVSAMVSPPSAQDLQALMSLDRKKDDEEALPPNHRGIVPWPRPPYYPIIGNLLDIDSTQIQDSIRVLVNKMGPAFEMNVLGNQTFVVASQEMCDFICNEAKFEKYISKALQDVRNYAGDGLFTAFSWENNWDIAHRILVPAFGPIPIRKMQAGMLDIASQMLIYWECHAGQPFEAANHFTRLTFDTIGWCSFKYRFNSFHSDTLHPFVEGMFELLRGSGHRAFRPAFLNKLFYKENARYWDTIHKLWATCDEVVAHRRANPDPDANDLLNNMINDRDPKTGEALSDENIRYQMVTFLIAGHETTSSTLAFALYYMLKQPRIYQKAREESDAAIAAVGGNYLKLNPSQFPYIDAILKEALRLHSPVPAFSVKPKNPNGEILPGGYYVPHGKQISCVVENVHQDIASWGEDAADFRPERFFEGFPKKPNAWKAFGNGARACVGRIFAIQEAILALALITARFDVELADPSYTLKVKQALALKPDNFNIKAYPRKGRHQNLLNEFLLGSAAITKEEAATANGTKTPPVSRRGKLYVLYGSNSGTCEEFAQEVAAEGQASGFEINIGALDDVVPDAKLPTDAPVIICTTSYEGQPTDNAREFIQSLRGLNPEDKPMAGVRYIIMGAGHRDWSETFHRIPLLVDKRLEELGGERLLELSLADAGDDLLGDFEKFKGRLWDHFGTTEDAKDVKSTTADKPSIKVLPATANSASGTFADMSTGTVVSQRVIGPAERDLPETRYITIRLPDGQSFQAGDYLNILPKNPNSTVDRVLKHFRLDGNAIISFDKAMPFIGANTPVRAADLFGSYVELSLPVAKRILPQLASMCSDAKDKAKIDALDADYTHSVTEKKLSLLELLESVPSCRAELDFFLGNLAKLKIRQYSISSSPLESKTEATLTYTVHKPASKSGNGTYLGVCSNYLAGLSEGDELFCVVKSSGDFHLPEPSTPVVLFAAGSGIAPFRGFIAERAAQKAAGEPVAETHLYFGCRDETSFLHGAELGEWVKSGVLVLHPVLSRSQQASFKKGGLKGTALPPAKKYIQDLVYEDREALRDLYKAGARFYTCGSGAKMAADLRKTAVRIISELKGVSAAVAEEKMEEISREKYKTDVFL
ncbi:NADPH reductase [Trichosporon asahii var. asahii CBS 8904]|uniref:NADPH reductase n=1 Tax=Trichosporon asahii var. asahii (strain CBS 8904) TaxID=1220162 RepID=K1WB62_TRIAC|nr:NADPH reductase [Trichosporon asahii var. asahii CBS 8904]